MIINTAFADNDTISVQNSTTGVATATSTPLASESSWSSMIPMVLIFVVFYFLLIRPQEKKRKQQEALVSSVKRGEEVMTAGGIFGTVTRVNDSDNTVELEIAKDTSIKILKSAISDIVSRKQTPSTTEKPEAPVTTKKKKTGK